VLTIKASKPSATLLVPVVFSCNADFPTAVLSDAVVLKCRAFRPIPTL